MLTFRLERDDDNTDVDAGSLAGKTSPYCSSLSGSNCGEKWSDFRRRPRRCRQSQG